MSDRSTTSNQVSKTTPAEAATVVKSSSGSRFATLDALRGLAVLCVILLHDGDNGVGRGNLAHSAVWPVLQHGYLGVQLFFVISGYCIQAAALSAQRSATPVATFLTRRGRRIYPPYWASIVFAVVLGLGTVLLLKRTWGSVFPLSGWDWLLNVLLLQGPFHAPDAVLVYWSLTIEVQFYLAMAIGLLFGRWAGCWHLGLSALYLLWLQTSFMGISGTVLAYWPEFACGIAAHGLVHRGTQLRFLPASLLCCTLCAILMRFAANPSMALREADGELVTPLKQLFCLGCAALVCALYRVDAWAERFRLVQGLGWLGVISYSLYLTHVPVGSRVFNMAYRYHEFRGWAWLIPAAVAFASQLVVGWYFYRWCERRWLNPPAAAIKSAAE